MLTEIYIEALDEELADQVWEAWDKREIDDQVAWLAWWLIINRTDLDYAYDAYFRRRPDIKVGARLC